MTIDDRLLRKAHKAGGHRTKREAVIAALEEYVHRCRRLKILSLFGSVEYNPYYDYKGERRAKRSRKALFKP